MADIEKSPTSGRRQVVVRFWAKEAVEFGRCLEMEPDIDPELGKELVKLGHELWESEL